ncbi:MAG: hypothetical protein A2Y16_01955 [Tenericutes bacterium GWF2_57_13]|nr:MAG: hypothetical protein A2Y16_01955 [Tenericutes bacterium GWF2_57_13]
MGKTPNRYIDIDPWKIRETGYHAAESQVSESLFSLANEYTGVRGFPEEGTTDRSLLGTYYNGLYADAPDQTETGYRGITKKVHYMINAANWLKTEITVDGAPVVLSPAVRGFSRTLDFRTGELVRCYRWTPPVGNEIELTFARFLAMDRPEQNYQRIVFRAVQGNPNINVRMSTDFSIVHWGRFNFWTIEAGASLSGRTAMIGALPNGQRLFTGFRLAISESLSTAEFRLSKGIGQAFSFTLSEGTSRRVDRIVQNQVEKAPDTAAGDLWERGMAHLSDQPGYEESLQRNVGYFDHLWNAIDVHIDGDAKDQQGIRFCLFQLAQTYHGFDPKNNIGAKGLTGEAYSGHAFWDTETYGLPFYLFSAPDAAKNLLLFRYNTLSQARERAKELDLKGACYPIATLNGYESCALWQHASLQPQPSTAVAFGIDHYVRNTGDEAFLAAYGLERLIEISRYLLARGDYNPDRTKFGFYGVMGPDEFQMMVNHNAYTNYMGMMTFETTLKALARIQKNWPDKYLEVIAKTGWSVAETTAIREAMDKTYVPYDPETKLYEQHQGYYDLPHVDIKKIPEQEFPLYAHWSYDRIYRNDMIKQPDVLMFMFLHNSRFSAAVKLANYEFYEPRCIHESSLSPSIHSVLAYELGKDAEAANFFEFATRMDLDDFNRNASEGLHLTSIAAAWVNIVYGFGGLRSDGDLLRLAPKLPSRWRAYSFHLVYRGVELLVAVDATKIAITADRELPVPIMVDREKVLLSAGTTVFLR